MTETVFYSWQSDLPNKTNRGFIGDCIDRAIKNLHADLGVEDALRAEEGVKGEPGNVDVARTIFERIDACGIFAPDISIVTPDGAKRPMPNPNVMIEYGRATATRGDSRIVPVFNTAFGDWLKDRPFDMRHKNAPLTYHLPEEHDQEQRNAARKELVKQFERAFREIIDDGLLEDRPAEEPAFEPVAPLTGQDSNVFPLGLLGGIDVETPLQEGDTNVWLNSGPKMFLRLIPFEADRRFAPLALRDLLQSSSTHEMLHEHTSGAFYYTRNGDGAAAFTIDPDMKDGQNRDAYAFGVTQAFTNGELWGVDTWLLDPELNKPKDNGEWPVIDPALLEEAFMVSLSEFLRFARDSLSLPLPLRCVAGLREIQDHRFEFPDGKYNRTFSHECIWETSIDRYDMPVHRILETFFTRVWQEFGHHRPQAAFNKWDRATGLDLNA